MRRFLGWAAAILALLAIAFALGPKVDGNLEASFDPASIGSDPVAYLAAREAQVSGIKPEQQKQIIWAGFPGQKTSVSIVYVHGFSASSGEVRPLPDLVAKSLNANLFYTRLAGHGRDGAAMAEATVSDWVNDYVEAVAIGRQIGERVVVMATSTGGSLAVAKAPDASVSADIAALVLISPNFGVQAGGSFLLTLPWGKQLAEMIVGKERGFEPRNARQAAFWTTRYPTVAVLPMARLVELAVDVDVTKITTPALFVISDGDKVVRPEITRGIADRWGGVHELLAVTDAEDPDQHVIAGDALSPIVTPRLAEQITAWLQGVL